MTCSVPAEQVPDQGELITFLAQGLTDEAIGKRLGISSRTVRRRVAEITALLGARSRFQAGARAAEAGWLEGQARCPVPRCAARLRATAL
jgi:DNA-binding NarL/FixJ family response regulator